MGGDATEKNITLGATALQGAQQSNVYFGSYFQSAYTPLETPESPARLAVYTDTDGTQFTYVNWYSATTGYFSSDPIKWRVLSKADGKLFLLSDQNLEAEKYNTSKVNVTWETSTIRSWLNGYDATQNGQNKNYTGDNFIKTAFSTKESDYVLTTAVENANNPRTGTDGGNNTEDRVFLLSMDEVKNTAYGFPNNTDASSTRCSTNTAYVVSGGRANSGSGRVGNNSWWLRTAGDYSNDAVDIDSTGIVAFYGLGVTNSTPVVRPAFNLDLSKVLFTSAAENGKPVSFSATTDLTNSDGYKLTLLDESRSGFSAEILKTDTKTYVSYAGATTGENEHITAMIVNASGEVTYYGSLKNIVSSTESRGFIEIDFAENINSGDKLYILNEQYNGNYKTDYASALHEVAIPTEVNAYNVSFNANGGTGTMKGVISKADYTLPECTFTRLAYSFKGWSFTADGEVIDGTSTTLVENTTLFAVWVSNSDRIVELDNAIADLDMAMKNGDQDLSDKLTALSTALNEAKGELEKTDADNKKDLEEKISGAQQMLQEAVGKVAQDLADAKDELAKAIDTKADTTTLNEKVDALNTAIASAETASKAYADEKDTALKTTLESTIATAKEDAIAAATKLVSDAKDELTKAIDTKADTATLNEKVDALNTAIASAETASKAYADEKDTALKTTLESTIATAKEDAIAAATNFVNDAKTELNKAIAEKADTTIVNAAIKNLQDAIDVLEDVKDNYVSADTALKTELEGKIAAAQTSLTAAIDALSAELDNVKSELDNVKGQLEAKDSQLEAKDSALQSFVTVVCVLSCVALGGSGAFVVWFFVDRKRKHE